MLLSHVFVYVFNKVSISFNDLNSTHPYKIYILIMKLNMQHQVHH